MKTKLGDINISSHDARSKMVEMHFGAKLNRVGRRLARDIASEVRGLDGQLIIVDTTFKLEVEGKDKEEQVRVANSFMRAWKSKLAEVDDEQIKQLICELPAGSDPALAANSTTRQ